MKNRKLDMLQGPLLSSIITYTVPIILTSILQLLFNAADLIVIGRFRGSITVAAVSTTNILTVLIVNVFIGLSVGAGVTVAHALGGKQEAVVRRTVHTAIPTALICGIMITVLGIIFAEDLLLLTQTPRKVLSLAALYMRIYFLGITFTLVYNFCASILRAAGDTKGPLLYLTIAGIINVLLNIFFVTVFHMGVDGVALATVISQGISAVLVVVALMRRTDACKLELKHFHFHIPQLLKIAQVGLPAGAQAALFSVANVIIQSAINSFGGSFMAGNGAAASIDGIVFATLSAFQQTAVNFIGQNAGARQYARIKRILFICLASATVVTISLSGLIYCFGPQLLSIYITDSQLAIQYGMVRLTWICIPFFLCAWMEITTGALRGLGVSLIPMVISIVGVCGVRILWIYTIFQIPTYHTPKILYLSNPISWIITFLAQLIAFYIVCRKRVKQYILP